MTVHVAALCAALVLIVGLVAFVGSTLGALTGLLP